MMARSCFWSRYRATPRRHSLRLESTPDDLEVADHLAIITEETDFLAAVD